MVRILDFRIILYLFVFLNSCVISNSLSAQVYTYSFSQSTNLGYAPLTGATLSSAVGDDDAEFGVQLPFPFSYGGNVHSEIGIGTNGWIRMGSSTLITDNLASENNVFGSSAGNLNFIFPLWDNLNPEGGLISYVTTGNSPDRIFIVEWKDIHWSGSGDNTAPLVNFQIWLHETTNIIEFRYGEMNDGQFPSSSIGLVGSSYYDFVSITPQNNAIMSTKTPNNGIDAGTTLTNVIYTFSPAPLCSGTPVSEVIISSSLTVCSVSGSMIDLSLSGLNISSGLLYQWEQSLDGQIWTNVTDGTGDGTPFYTTSVISSAIAFRCKITCSLSNEISYSNSLQLQSGIQACYCPSVAQSVDFESDDIGNIQFADLNNGTSFPVVNNPDANRQYSDFTTSVTSPVLTKGADYPLSISQISSSDAISNGHINVFIDYNQNGLYEEGTNEHVFQGKTFSSLNISTVLGSITIPVGATTGITGMRVILVTSLGGRQLEAPCDLYSYGETEDYLVQIVDPPACAGTPDGGIVMASTLYACNSLGNESTIDLSLFGSSVLTGLTYQWQMSADSINWNDVVGATHFTYGSLPITSDTYFRCSVTCAASGLVSYSSVVHIYYSSLGCYCTSKSSDDGDNIDIGNVTFASINNGVGAPVLGNPTATKSYTDFTNLPPAKVFLGETYPISVSQIEMDEDFYSTYVQVYIDFNGDGAFNEQTEMVVMKPTFSSDNSNVTSNITIPLNAVPGLTKMRVILYYLYDFYWTACDVYGTGETEDYILDISIPPICTGQPSAGTAIASEIYLCNSTPTNTILSLTGVSVSSGIAYQWQQSSDSTLWTDINGNITASDTITSISATTYFRCKITCISSSQFAYSKPVKINVSFLGCYCTSFADNREDQDIGNVTLGSLNNGDASLLRNNPYANHVYTDFRYLPPPLLQKEIGIPISITSIEQRDIGDLWPSYILVYIDYNHDGSYDASAELAFSGSTTKWNAVAQGTLTIPHSALNGITGMRVTMQDAGDRATGYLPCGDYDWGETEDYLIDIATPPACAGAPNAGSAVAKSAFVCNISGGSTTVFLKNVSIVSGLTIQWQESSDNTVWNSASGLANNISYNTPILYVTKYYRAKITCTATGQYSYSSSTIITASALGCFCESGASDADWSDIGNVKIDTLLNNGVIPNTLEGTQYNPSSNSTYSDFTSISPITLSGSKSYPVQITQMDRNFFIPAIVSIYIDYNQNGVFDIPDEMAFSDQTDDANTPFVAGNLIIPSSAKSGLTRMRVVLENVSPDPNVPNLNSPCGLYVDGETEDYHIRIAGITEIEKDLEKSVTVYPNPTPGEVIIKISNAQQSNAVIRIIGVAGDIIYEGKYQIDLSNSIVKLNMSANSSGIYFVNVIMNGLSFTKKIILVK